MAPPEVAPVEPIKASGDRIMNIQPALPQVPKPRIVNLPTPGTYVQQGSSSSTDTGVGQHSLVMPAAGSEAGTLIATGMCYRQQPYH